MKVEKLIESLLEEIKVKYEYSLKDRTILGKLEWNSDENYSILGEVESWADIIFGVTNSILNNKGDNFYRNKELLGNNSVFKLNLISEWIALEGVNYYDYLTYILSVEGLRFLTFSFMDLKKNKLAN